MYLCVGVVYIEGLHNWWIIRGLYIVNVCTLVFVLSFDPEMVVFIMALWCSVFSVCTDFSFVSGCATGDVLI